MKSISVLFFYITSLFLFKLNAATITSTASGGNWSVGGSWVGGNIPSSGDSVIIAGGATITVNGNYNCLAVYFASGASSTLLVSGTNRLAVTNSITFSNPSSNQTQLLQIGAGTVTCTNLNMVNTSNNRINRLTVSTGTFTASGNITMPGSTSKNFFTCSGAATVTIGGSWTNSGAVTPSTATFIYNGSSTQTIPALTYQKLRLSGSGMKTLAGNVVCTDSFNIAAGATLNNSGTASITTNGVFYVAGTYNESSLNGNPIAFNGAVNIAATGTITFTVAESLTISGAMAVNGLFSTAGAVTVNATVTNNDSFMVAGDVTGTGAIMNATANSFLEFDGQTISVATLTFTAPGNTVALGRVAGTQTIPNVTYQNLIIKGANTKNLGANLTVNGNLIVENSSTLNVSTSNYSIILYGNFVNNGTFNARTTTSTFTMAGASQTISGATNPITFNHLTVNDGSTTSLSQHITSSGNVNINGGGVLDLTSYSANRTTSGGALTVTGTLILGATAGGQPGSNFPLNFSTVTLTAGTVNYNASSGAQTVFATTYSNLTLGNTIGSQTMGGAVSVHNTLRLSGGKLSLGSNTLTLNGNIIGMTGSSCLTANGSSTIVIGGSGALGSSLFLDQTSVGITNRLASLTYNRSSQTITLGDTVEVTGMITPGAGLLQTANKLKLISNANGDAGITAGTGAYISGSVVVQRYIPSSGRRWRFLASPSAGATLADWKEDIFITGNGGATNGFDATSTNYASVYSYDESANGDLNQGWSAATNITNALVPGKGYRVFVRGDRTAGRLDGTINNQNAVTLKTVKPVTTGDVNMSPIYTSTGVPANDGWNLMGNPYPCAIDWNAFHDAGRSGSAPNYSGTDYQRLDAVVYVLDPGGASTAYASYNAFSGAVVGDLAGGVIPSGAAFWVKASAASPSMTMKETYKTNVAAGSVFKTIPDNIQFSIKVLRGGIVGDEAVLKYVPEASAGFDEYDILKMEGGDIHIASMGVDGSFLAANYKAFNGVSDTVLLSLGFANSGEYTMVFNDVENIGLDHNQTIYLFDLFTNTIQDLRTTDGYTFTVDVTNASTFGNRRFKLVVGAITTAVPELAVTMNAPTFFMYPTITTGEAIICSSVAMKENVEVFISDLSGKTIASYLHHEWSNNTLRIDLSAYLSGLYFIRIARGNRSIQTLKCMKL